MQSPGKTTVIADVLSNLDEIAGEARHVSASVSGATRSRRGTCSRSKRHRPGRQGEVICARSKTHAITPKQPCVKLRHMVRSIVRNVAPRKHARAEIAQTTSPSSNYDASWQ